MSSGQTISKEIINTSCNEIPYMVIRDFSVETLILKTCMQCLQMNS